jgi:hypothetical protein
MPIFSYVLPNLCKFFLFLFRKYPAGRFALRSGILTVQFHAVSAKESKSLFD